MTYLGKYKLLDEVGNMKILAKMTTTDTLCVQFTSEERICSFLRTCKLPHKIIFVTKE